MQLNHIHSTLFTHLKLEHVAGLGQRLRRAGLGRGGDGLTEEGRHQGAKQGARLGVSRAHSKPRQRYCPVLPNTAVLFTTKQYHPYLLAANMRARGSSSFPQNPTPVPLTWRRSRGSIQVRGPSSSDPAVALAATPTLDRLRGRA